MKSENKQRMERRNEFAAWWRKNRLHLKAHMWLAHHARNTIFSWAMHPNVFTHTQMITKRFFKSEYKRLGQSNAWYLYRITHPLHFERVARIKTHAAFLEAQVAAYKEVKLANKKEGNK